MDDQERDRRRYSMAAIYALDAIKYYLLVAPSDNAPYALVNEVLVWSSGGEATWGSVQTVAMIVLDRKEALGEAISRLNSPEIGALVAARQALETALCLVTTPSEGVLEATYRGSRLTKDLMDRMFKSGVAQGAVNFLQKLPPHPV